MRISIDTPNIYGNELSPDLNRWFTNIVDQINSAFSNIISDRTANLTGSGAGPYSVDVVGMTAASIITATIQTSTNPVSIVSVTAKDGGFDITFSADPGAVCTVNYMTYISNWAAQGV